MPSKKKTDGRRAELPRKSDYTPTFAKAWKRLNKAGRFNMNRLKEAMLLIIANDAPLGAEWKDHALIGSPWIGCRECHVGRDFLLVYRIGIDGGVTFVDTGSHSELFG